ncbi:MAG: sigma-70 family RNA polymerase sigma factor [Chitinophagaceae bacterium]|nr:sigma-70 family RNA polymerase sigma factor [Chitinophagaceae bacterium]MCW5927502.1 sigma-70 family RNA polymerase sigma factor [Chitinophagaceae bacterium]
MSSTPLDTDLINGCIHNDRKAQELLYKKFYVSMGSICTRYTHNENDTIEVLNNGFLKVFKNIQSFDPAKASLYTWIRTIMVNTAIDFIRQNQKHKQHLELDYATEPFIESDALQRLNTTELLHHIKNLPTATQTVFNLYVIEGFTHKEIGLKMGISEGTSKWHLSEARRLLQKSLKTLHVA